MLKEIIKKNFGTLEEISKKENFSVFEIKYESKDLNKLSKDLNKENYSLLKEYFSPLNYSWEVYIEDYNFSISQSEYNELIINDDDDDSVTQIIFKINKKGNRMLIIEESLFNSFISSIDLESVLKWFNTIKFPVKFITEDFQFEIGDFEEQKRAILSNQCNFRNYSQFPFSPDYFYFTKEESEFYPDLSVFLDKLSLVYCLIYIFDSSEISKNTINLIISGFKTVKVTLDFKEINLQNLKYYYQIYTWIYSDRNKVEDKIGISKNILTSYLKDNSIEIDNSVFRSILSSHQIYIKGDISKYFEARDKIIEKIEQTIDGVNKTITSFISSFQKSTFVFVSYFLTVFIFRVVNKGALNRLDKIFTKETSLLGIGFIVISFLFFVSSLVTHFLDKKRLKKRYNNVKERYKDILIEEDINKILKDDFEYKDEIKYLNGKIITYSVIWFLSIVTFVVVLYLTSDFLELNPT